MYHGGSTPKGDGYYFNDEAYGLPKISYDFQAPIGEFGQVREGFHRLKLLHWFVQDFGDLLAPMTTVLPENASSLTPENVTDLRYAVRIKDNSGFLFINNFQDDTLSADKKNIQVKINTGEGIISIPESGGFDINSEENAIFSFNLNINGTKLKYATAQLLTRSDDLANPFYVFFRPEGAEAEFSFANGRNFEIEKNTAITIVRNSKRILIKCLEPVTEYIINANGKKTRVLVIDKSLALKSYNVTIGGKKCLIFSDAIVLQDGNSFTLLSDGENNYNVSVYPKLTTTPSVSNGKIAAEPATHFTNFNISLPATDISIHPRQISQKKYMVSLPASLNGLNDLFLEIDYTGDTGMGFLDGELVTDEFYKGIPWKIGLKKFYPEAGGKEMIFYFRPLIKNATYLSDLNPESVPDFGKNNNLLQMNHITVIPEYSTTLKFQ